MYAVACVCNAPKNEKLEVSYTWSNIAQLYNIIIVMSDFRQVSTPSSSMKQ